MAATVAKAYVYTYTVGPLPLWVPLTIIGLVVVGLIVLFIVLRKR